jgi:hypothetical protein
MHGFEIKTLKTAVAKNFENQQCLSQLSEIISTGENILCSCLFTAVFQEHTNW